MRMNNNDRYLYPFIQGVQFMKKIIRLWFGVMVALLLLTVLPAAGTQGNDNSINPSLSADGRYVAFESDATNLVAGDTSGMRDIFVRDRTTGTTTLVSKDSAGVEGNGYSFNPAISADGRYVTYESVATSLVSGDTNSAQDIFVRDRQTGTTTLVSKSSAGVAGIFGSYAPSISSDGRYVVFQSHSTNLVTGDTNSAQDIFVRDRQTGTTSRVSKNSAGSEGNANSYDPSISADGRYVLFSSLATNLVSGDLNGKADIFVRDRQTGTTMLLSRDSAGVEGNGDSFAATISEDGRYVAFYSEAANLVSGDTNGAGDIFVRDRQTGTTTLVSKNSAGVEGTGYSDYPLISEDGRYVTFGSDATNLVAGDTNAKTDIFVRDRQTGTTTLVSKDSSGVEGDGNSVNPSISSDGRFVAYFSYATSLVTGDTNGKPDIFVRDRQTGTTTLVSKS
jgi:Tol biopolymer transport system component